MPSTFDNPSRTTKVMMEIVEITPEMAHELLAKNTHNRTLSDEKVRQYAGAIKRGEWRFNGDAIRIDRDGNLLDGQHRLHGVIKANKPIRTLIVSGLDPAAQETMDLGKKRGLSDILKLRGQKGTARLGGAIVLLYIYTKRGTLDSKGLNPQPTPQQLLAFFEKHSDLVDHLYVPHDKRVKTLLTPSSTTAINYLLSKVDEEDAKLFWEYLATGNSLASDDPIYHLRERLLREQAKPHGRISPVVRAALTIKAFNLWRQGTKIGHLRWSGGGASREEFPRLVDSPIVPETDR